MFISLIIGMRIVLCDVKIFFYCISIVVKVIKLRIIFILFLYVFE